MSDWELVCGLEVHCHLKTKTKMFCRCALEYGAAENMRTCPICLAHPGALPVPNGRAIEWTVKLGNAFLGQQKELLETVQREHHVNRALMAQELAFLDHLLKLAGVAGHESYDAGGDRLATTAADVTGHRAFDLEV